MLAAAVRREAVWLACGVMAADIAANWAGNWKRILNYPAHLAGNVPWLMARAMAAQAVQPAAKPRAQRRAAFEVSDAGQITDAGCAGRGA